MSYMYRLVTRDNETRNMVRISIEDRMTMVLTLDGTKALTKIKGNVIYTFHAVIKSGMQAELL